MTDEQKIFELLIHDDLTNNELGVQLLIGLGLEPHEIIDDDAELWWTQTGKLLRLLNISRESSELLHKHFDFSLGTVLGKSINNYIKDCNNKT
jgi:hypothetical protein